MGFASQVSIEDSFYNTPQYSDDFESANFKAKLADGTTHKFTDTEMRTVHNMFSLWSSTGLNDNAVLDNFNRFYAIFPDMEMPADLKSYIFITRPEMNLMGDGASTSYRTNGNAGITLSADNQSDARLEYLAAMNPEIVYMLTEEYSSSHSFIPYLQGRAESLQLPDYQIRTSDFTVPFYSFKYAYPTDANESITGGTFDVTFREDSELRITKMFQFWIYYMDAILKNKMTPTRQHIIDNYYDFMCSVYEIICDPTSEKILFWAKYTGCFPTSVPLSNLSHNLGSTMDNKVSITFSYMMVETMDPRIISDFNYNATGTSGSTEPVYDTDYGVVGDSLVGMPSIQFTPKGDGLLLKWYPRVSGSISTLNKNTPVLQNIDIAAQNAAAYVAQMSRGGGRTTTTTKTVGTTATLSSYLSNNSDSIR
jgi:hypothetical protein